MNKALAVKIAKVCISAFLIIYILQTADRAELIQTIKSADIYLLIIAFSVNGIGMIPRIYKWQIILAVQEIHVPFKIKS
jgi:uncharacterized membrane protein YbhN (UPF0104 family)